MIEVAENFIRRVDDSVDLELIIQISLGQACLTWIFPGPKQTQTIVHEPKQTQAILPGSIWVVSRRFNS